MPVLAEMNEAGEAISEIQAQDMSAFGLHGIRQSFDYLEPHQQLADRRVSFGSAAEQESSKSKESPKSNRRMRESYENSPRSEGGSHSKQQKVSFKQQPGADVKEITTKKCAAGNVAKWGNWYNVDAIEVDWKKANPSISWKIQFLSPLLYQGENEETLDSRTPAALPEATKLALRKFRGIGLKKYEVKQPSSFL